MFPENMKTVFHPSQLRCLSNVSILGIEGLLPQEQVGKSGLAAAAEGNDFVTFLITNISFHNVMGIVKTSVCLWTFGKWYIGCPIDSTGWFEVVVKQNIS